MGAAKHITGAGQLDIADVDAYFTLLQAALKQKHTHGWSDEVLAQRMGRVKNIIPPLERGANPTGLSPLSRLMAFEQYLAACGITVDPVDGYWIGDPIISYVIKDGHHRDDVVEKRTVDGERIFVKKAA